MANRQCLNFPRSSATFPTLDCSLVTKNYREQLNLLSSYFDGTQIYGDSLEKSKSLRSFLKGQLKTSDGILNNRPYLPKSTSEQCSSRVNTTCFMAGESRTSENLGLTGVHTLFMRAHNRIASQLASLNPAWSDETLYQETRRILLAVYQHIIYTEWIPATIGNGVDLELKVQPLNRYYTGYNPTVSVII